MVDYSGNDKKEKIRSNRKQTVPFFTHDLDELLARTVAFRQFPLLLHTPLACGGVVNYKKVIKWNVICHW
jgi:hypothetical protein